MTTIDISVLPAATTNPDGSNLTQVTDEVVHLAFLVVQPCNTWLGNPTPTSFEPVPTANLSPLALHDTSKTALFW
eukprot:CAMPEP_0202946642 /NCGR_PEP_ID=MMETSP1395-20130829/9678_1 /ASSEMBLY_ACC=CAM_ASM_000871 /TAXON_ID=5961 /ORGANISM="Blepharisma japonicum, Strain Stock R1072" /LENGTH=74 /DNA_ID=CAMNT_0049647371 /DNA_START=535 /DNA_END=759 /DNA_ORIENTATION=-